MCLLRVQAKSSFFRNETVFINVLRIFPKYGFFVLNLGLSTYFCVVEPGKLLKTYVQ